MNKLESELQRLYCLPDQAWPSQKPAADATAIKLLDAAGGVRCLVISVEGGGNWAAVAALYQGVQVDLDLPAPAISVSGDEGYQIWFSLAEPVSAQLAQNFMAGLCRNYLVEVKTAKLKLRPGMTPALGHLPRVPAKLGSAERWSAFIDPSMGSMFVEETWLEMPPSLNQQAAMLAGLASIKGQDFQQALKALAPPAASEVGATGDDAGRLSNQGTLDLSSNFTHPKDFLLAVMNDVQASTDQRIAAAIALLPVFEKIR